MKKKLKQNLTTVLDYIPSAAVYISLLTLVPTGWTNTATLCTVFLKAKLRADSEKEGQRKDKQQASRKLAIKTIFVLLALSVFVLKPWLSPEERLEATDAMLKKMMLARAESDRLWLEGRYFLSAWSLIRESFRWN